MSVLFYPESIRILGSDASGNNVMLCEMAVDDIANLPAANAFISDGYVLSMGCTAIAINDNSKHRLNGVGNWVQIAAGTSTYTRAEIDSLLSAINAENTSQQAEINYAINTGTKNLLWNHEAGYSETIHGRKFTVLSDGGIKIDGAASDSTNADFYIIGSWGNRNVLLNESNEQLTMRLSCTDDYSYNEIRFRVLDRSTGSTVSESGIEANKDRTFSHIVTTVFITVRTTVTLPTNGIIVYPMIRPAAITDQTYEPYAPTNRQLYEMILQLQGG